MFKACKLHKDQGLFPSCSQVVRCTACGGEAFSGQTFLFPNLAGILKSVQAGSLLINCKHMPGISDASWLYIHSKIVHACIQVYVTRCIRYTIM